MPFVDIAREPDHVEIITQERGRESQVQVRVAVTDGRPVVFFSAATATRWIRLRWRGEVGPRVLVQGDAWERGYGDLQWCGHFPDRVLPWYFLWRDGDVIHGYGVETQPAALCYWTIDPLGINLWLDVRSGGDGSLPGDREVELATVIQREGRPGETPFQASFALCRELCPAPRVPDQPVYGSNNWYYAYGNTSHDEILTDSDLVADLCPDQNNRPYMVIDDGWQIGRTGGFNGGPWTAGNDQFPDMPGLAAAMRDKGVRPGIWYRPLLAPHETPESRQLVDHRPTRFNGVMLDPSVPEVLEQIGEEVRRLRRWGYGLIKCDYTTYDIFRTWGAIMGNWITEDGWTFKRRELTSAEVVRDLYRVLREGTGDGILIGCNTFGHLGAGLFDLQRTGDDTSGVDWARTRKMGVNTLAFRMGQHETFFVHDADCVGLTDKIPWRLNRQWLDLVARSSTALFVSADPKAVGPEQRQALEAAFGRAARRGEPGEPLDWLDNNCPMKWRLDGEVVEYNWFE